MTDKLEEAVATDGAIKAMGWTDARMIEAGREAVVNGWREGSFLTPHQYTAFTYALMGCRAIIPIIRNAAMDEADCELVEDFLHELDGWETAYPLSAFPEPDLKRAAELLKAGGMTLDAVSASNMRYVVKCIAPKARAVILALKDER
jgi:hypothetical protein